MTGGSTISRDENVVVRHVWIGQSYICWSELSVLARAAAHVKFEAVVDVVSRSWYDVCDSVDPHADSGSSDKLAIGTGKPAAIFVLNTVCCCHRVAPVPLRYPFAVSLLCLFGAPVLCIASSRLPPHPSPCRPHHPRPSQRSPRSPQEPARRPRSTSGSPTRRAFWELVRQLLLLETVRPRLTCDRMRRSR